MKAVEAEGRAGGAGWPVQQQQEGQYGWHWGMKEEVGNEGGTRPCRILYFCVYAAFCTYTHHASLHISSLNLTTLSIEAIKLEIIIAF